MLEQGTNSDSHGQGELLDEDKETLEQTDVS